jgi:hypothetical protein
MDPGLFWTAVGSAAGVAGSALVIWQTRLQILERRDVRRLRLAGEERTSNALGGFPVAVPLGRLPAEIRGRDPLLAELLRGLARRPAKPGHGGRRLARRRPGASYVLAGMGGLGKSTLALATAQAARQRGWQVWWVTATDQASVTGGMLEVLRQLRAPATVTEAVRSGVPASADIAWQFLNGPHAAGHRWLLIFDNADDPRAMAASGSRSPADYTGWLRPDPAGMVIVTTRHRDARSWGPGIALLDLMPLDDVPAAKMLADLAPNVPDPGGGQALELARRLGGLPLALYLAGSYLSSPFARWRTFADYRMALDSVELPAALDDLDEMTDQARATIQRTWDVSLDALAADGLPQARQVLLRLSCYAPATPIPARLLQGEPHQEQRSLRAALRGLATTGLISISAPDKPAAPLSVAVHPVVADVNRACLLTKDSPVLPVIGQEAVQSLRSAIEPLDPRHPADWGGGGGIFPPVLWLV